MAEISSIVDHAVSAQKFAYRIRSAARFFPVPRRHLIGKGIRHLGSPDS
jgi:hypothetical protein